MAEGMTALAIRRDRIPMVLHNRTLMVLHKLAKAETNARVAPRAGDRQRARWREQGGGGAVGGHRSREAA